MKRQKSLLLCFLLILLYSFPVSVKASARDAGNIDIWPSGPNIYAEAAIVMEASTGLILYEKNIHQKYYPASITKIMTGLLTVENASLGETVTFSRDSVFKVDLKSSRIGIDVGEQLSIQQCLYGILLESANEVTYATAEHIAGSIPAFAEMMNARAKEIGCLNTNFTNPHGLHEEDHMTTAYDMALITREAMKNETFRKIAGTRTYQIPPTNIQPQTRYLRHHHRFILKQDYFYDDAIAGKTGYTSKARYTLATVAKRGDLELIVILMKSDTFANQYIETQKLLNFAYQNFTTYPISDIESATALHESPMFTRYTPLLSKSDTPIMTGGKGFLVLPVTASFEDARKEVSFYPSSEIIEGGNIIGTISYTYNDKYVGGADIIYNKVDKPTLIYYGPEKSESFLSPIKGVSEKPEDSLRPVIIGLLVGFVVLVIGFYFVFVERPRIKRRNAYYKKRENRRRFQDTDFLDL